MKSHQTERLIMAKTIDVLLQAGFELSDGDEKIVNSSDATLDSFYENYGEVVIYAHKMQSSGTKLRGWVRFILNNDIDVLHDYTVNLEEWMHEVNEYIDVLIAS